MFTNLFQCERNKKVMFVTMCMFPIFYSMFPLCVCFLSFNSLFYADIESYLSQHLLISHLFFIVSRNIRDLTTRRLLYKGTDAHPLSFYVQRLIHF